MELTADQCSAIAQIIPVLMLAMVLEQRIFLRHLKLGRVGLVGVGGAYGAGASATWIAVLGIDGGQQGLEAFILGAAFWLVVLLLVMNTLLAIAAENQQSAD
ncbi:MAG TPA: hypothetical protein VLI04_08155 [Nocardioidaceae bacterium]|nr:hypothetical protein [Nocardioidaceae bacterium]